MSAPPRLQFWHEFASTYSYPAAMRVAERAAARGVAVEWRPFLLGPLFHKQQGLTDSPFNVFPDKGRYMWRDLTRVCEAEGLALVRPDVFPRHSLLAARVALVGARDGWIARYSPAVYLANFAHNADIADPDVLRPIIAAAGVDPEAVLDEAGGDAIKKTLRAVTDEALRLGLFGAPSFVTADGEMFWGHDRMDAAIAWAATH
jgi:2-hydroxychromene-2-carboxylate isomerase